MAAQRLLAFFCVVVSTFAAVATSAVRADDGAAKSTFAINRSEDDAEEGSDGTVDLTNEDLDLGQLSGFESAARTGLRFDGIGLSQGQKIKRAFVQFTMEGYRIKSKPTRLIIHAELTANPEPFEEEKHNISARKLSEASVAWSPQPWDPTRAKDEKPQTPDLSQLIQELADQKDWEEGNAIVLIISGDGERDAVSFDGGGREAAPMLQIETE